MATCAKWDAVTDPWTQQVISWMCTQESEGGGLETVVVQFDALSTLFGQGFVAGASVLLLAIPIRLILKAVRN